MFDGGRYDALLTLLFNNLPIAQVNERTGVEAEAAQGISDDVIAPLLESVVGRIHPKLVKKVEKEILTEAKNEEKHLKHAIQDLTQVEKSENKAQKTIFKADTALQNATKKEHRTLQDMYKAEHNHDIALSKAQEAQKELEALKAAHAKAKETLTQKSIYVEQAMKSHDEHVKIRNEKLSALRGTYGPQAVAEVVSEVNQSDEPNREPNYTNNAVTRA